VPEAGELRDWAAELVDRARSEGVELTGEDGLLTALVRQVLQCCLEDDAQRTPDSDTHFVFGVAQDQASTVQVQTDQRVMLHETIGDPSFDGIRFFVVDCLRRR
jgi:hypothetical protein